MFSILPYRSFSRQINPYNSFFSGLSKGFVVDITQDDENYYLSAELPGVSEDNINISVVENKLVIKAKFESENKEEGDQYYYTERRFGEFERQFNIENIQADNISANLEKGVLKLTLPKKAKEDSSRQIPINTTKS